MAALEIQAENALEVERSLGGFDAIRRVGEVDQAVGAADDVVGAVQAAAGPGFGERGHVGTVGGHPRQPPAVLLAEDDAAAGSQVWPLAARVWSRKRLSVPSGASR